MSCIQILIAKYSGEHPRRGRNKSSIHLPDFIVIEDELYTSTVSLTLALSQRERELNAMAMTLPGLKPRARLNAPLALKNCSANL